MRDSGGGMIESEKARDKKPKGLRECERVKRDMLVAGRKEDADMVLKKKEKINDL